MKLFVTGEYLAETKKRITDLRQRLDDIRKNKTAAYNEDTNTWHDNFAYEHLTREEKQTERQLMDAMADLNNMQAVPAGVNASTDTVSLYCMVDLQRENMDTGYITEYRMGIVPLGAQDMTRNLYAYNMPAAYPLFGHTIGDVVTIAIPSGTYTVTIIAINPIQPD